MRSALITIFSVLLIDQVLKIWIKANFALGEVAGELGFIKLQFIENPGMAFGMTFGEVWGKVILSLFRVLAVIAIGFIIRNLINNKAHRGLVISGSLIFAGALGNILDSAFFGFMFDQGTTWNSDFQEWVGYAGVAEMNFNGYAGFLQGCVVDMIHFEFYYPSWMPFDLAGSEVFPPIFNIADFAISFGVGIIIVFNKRFLGNGKGDFSVFKKQKEKKEMVEESAETVSE